MGDGIFEDDKKKGALVLRLATEGMKLPADLGGCAAPRWPKLLVGALIASKFHGSPSTVKGMELDLSRSLLTTLVLHFFLEHEKPRLHRFGHEQCDIISISSFHSSLVMCPAAAPPSQRMPTKGPGCHSAVASHQPRYDNTMVTHHDVFVTECRTR